METRDARTWSTPALTHLSISLDTALTKSGSNADGQSPGKQVV